MRTRQDCSTLAASNTISWLGLASRKERTFQAVKCVVPAHSRPIIGPVKLSRRRPLPSPTATRPLAVSIAAPAGQATLGPAR